MRRPNTYSAKKGEGYIRTSRGLHYLAIFLLITIVEVAHYGGRFQRLCVKRKEVNDKHDRDASSQHSVLVVQPPLSKTSITFPAFIDSAFPKRARNQMETSKVTKKSIFTTHRQRRPFRLSPSSVLRTRRATTNDARATADPKRATETNATETHERQRNQAVRGLTVRNLMKRNR